MKYRIRIRISQRRWYGINSGFLHRINGPAIEYTNVYGNNNRPFDRYYFDGYPTDPSSPYINLKL